MIVILSLLAGCTGLSDGATRQVFVDAACTLDRVPEGPERTEVYTMTDAGYVNATRVGVARATAFASELARALVDDALSADEVSTLRTLSEGFGTESVALHEGELLAKRQAEAEHRRLVAARAATPLEGADLWPTGAPLAERGKAVGWTPENCHRQRESGYQTEACWFSDGEEAVTVGFTIFATRPDARLAANPAPWERGAVAFHRGRRVLKVRSTDRAAAEFVMRGVATEATRKGPIPLGDFQASLTALGFRVDACRTDEDAYTHDLACDIRSSDAGGFALLQWTDAQPIDPGDGTMTYDAGDAQLDLDGLVVRARVHTTTAATPRLAHFRD